MANEALKVGAVNDYPGGVSEWEDAMKARDIFVSETLGLDPGELRGGSSQSATEQIRGAIVRLAMSDGTLDSKPCA